MPDYIDSYTRSSRQASDIAIQLPTFSGLRRIATTVTILVLALLAIAFFVPINVVIGFRAIAVPEEGIQSFRAPITGQVTFPIREGSVVKEGSTVAVIQSTLASSQMDLAADSTTNLAAEKVRVSDASLAATVGVLETRMQLAEARHESILATISSIQSEIDIRRRQLESADELLVRAQTLGAKQLISDLQLASYRDRKLDLESTIESLTRQAREAQQTLSANSAEIEAIRLQTVEAQLANKHRSLEIGEAMETVLSQSRVAIIAPRDSRVASLQIPTGALVNEGAPLLTLVPLDETLVLEARVSHSDVAMLEIGQAATVTFDAFPSSRFGRLDGNVFSIAYAASPALSSTGVETEGLYIVRLLIDNTSSPILIKSLRPGMVASVRVKVAERPIARRLFTEVQP